MIIKSTLWSEATGKKKRQRICTKMKKTDEGKEVTETENHRRKIFKR